METWKECGWAKCSKRFEPGRRSNKYQYPDGKPHKGAVYCSNRCKQKAYRSRLQTPSSVPNEMPRSRPADVTCAVSHVSCQYHNSTVTPSCARPLALCPDRSTKPILRLMPDGVLWRIEWPDISPSDLVNLTRAKSAAIDWARGKHAGHIMHWCVETRPTQGSQNGRDMRQ